MSLSSTYEGFRIALKWALSLDWAWAAVEVLVVIVVLLAAALYLVDCIARFTYRHIGRRSQGSIPNDKTVDELTAMRIRHWKFLIAFANGFLAWGGIVAGVLFALAAEAAGKNDLRLLPLAGGASIVFICGAYFVGRLSQEV